MSTSALIDSCRSLPEDASVRVRRTPQQEPSQQEPPQQQVIALFDHEEVGSLSCTGAQGPLMKDTMSRIAAGVGIGHDKDPNATAIRARSFHISCAEISPRPRRDLAEMRISRGSSDMSHAIHPNYPGKHDKAHGPLMARGLVIKHNANQR